MTVRNPNTVGYQGSAIAYIDDAADRMYIAPIISGISRGTRRFFFQLRMN